MNSITVKTETVTFSIDGMDSNQIARSLSAVRQHDLANDPNTINQLNDGPARLQNHQQHPRKVAEDITPKRRPGRPVGSGVKAKPVVAEQPAPVETTAKQYTPRHTYDAGILPVADVNAQRMRGKFRQMFYTILEQTKDGSGTTKKRIAAANPGFSMQWISHELTRMKKEGKIAIVATARD
jgi:hypothetical protein